MAGSNARQTPEGRTGPTVYQQDVIASTTLFLLGPNHPPGKPKDKNQDIRKNKTKECCLQRNRRDKRLPHGLKSKRMNQRKEHAMEMSMRETRENSPKETKALERYELRTF